MNLSEDEQQIFELLKSKAEVTLDEITRRMAVSRQSMVVRMKYLTAKLAPEGWIVANKSGIGRGAKAVYSMEKKF